MLGPQDIKQFMQATMPEGKDQLPDNEAEYEYDISHLDYTFVANCNDVKELKKLLRILKSGKEGYYTDLERAFEKRIETLDPEFITAESQIVAADVKKQLDDDLNLWLKDMKEKETKHSTTVKTSSRERKPPAKTINKPVSSVGVVEQSNIKAQNQNPNSQITTSRIKSSDYRAWDAFDVDAELERLDQEAIPKKADTAVLNKNNDRLKGIPTNVSASKKTLQERSILSDREKWKGNEAIRSKDYEEAILYYTRGISLCPKSSLYTNRALAHLKMNNFEKAEKDCSLALNYECTADLEMKAYMRRGISKMKRGKYPEAVNDFDKALGKVPGSYELGKLKSECLGKMENLGMTMDDKKRSSEVPVKKTKMKIVDVEEIEDVITTDNFKLLSSYKEEITDAFEGEQPTVITTDNSKVLSSCKEELAAEVSEGKQPTVAVSERKWKKLDIVEIDSDSENESVFEEEISGKPDLSSPEINVSVEIEPPEQANKSTAFSVSEGGSAHEVLEKTVLPSPETKVSEEVESSRQIYANAKTSYEFESTWKAIKRNKSVDFSVFIVQHSSANLLKLLSATNCGEVDLIQDVFKALQNLVNENGLFVKEIFEGITSVPRIGIAFKMMTKLAKLNIRETINILGDQFGQGDLEEINAKFDQFLIK